MKCKCGVLLGQCMLPKSRAANLRHLERDGNFDEAASEAAGQAVIANPLLDREVDREVNNLLLES